MHLKIQLENSPHRIVRAPVRRDGTHAHLASGNDHREHFS